MSSPTATTATGSRPGDPQGDLKRSLGWVQATAIHVGTILGSGIFIAPAAVAAAVPGAKTAIGLWVLGGVIAACGAACYGECGSRLPRTGGFYVFYREAYGPPVAFVGGWVALLVTYPASIAAITLILSRYFTEALPGLGIRPELVAVIALLSVAVLNVLGVRTAAGVQTLLTGAKVIALATLCLTAILVSRGTPSPTPAFVPTGVDLTALLGALVVMLWTYEGWSNTSLVAGEIRNPGPVLGRAVVVGTAILVAVYALVQTSVNTLLSPTRAASSERVVSDAVGAGLGSGSAGVVALLVVLSTFGSVHGVVLTASRLGFAMARDGVFLRWFGQVHPRYGTPARSVASIVGASLVYVWVADFQNLLAFFSFSVWIFYGLTAVALLVLRRGRVGEENAWRVPGGIAVPGVVLMTSAGITVSLCAQDPRRSLIGMIVLLAGFPAYGLWRRLKGNPETPA